MNKSIYFEIKEARNGELIPYFQNGKSIDSVYNPDREATTIVNQISSKYDYFILTGLGSGKIVNELLNANKKCRIFVIENSQEDYIFLSKMPLVNKLFNNNRITFSTIINLIQDLQNDYIPAIYGEFKLIERPNWISQINLEELNHNISSTINKINNDYATQQFFGKKWLSNIIKNLKLHSSLNNNQREINSYKKNAIIVAAGPSLDSKIDYINEIKKDHYIIATDTAFSILSKYNITCDFVLSIDGQSFSYNHFFKNSNNFINTFFLFDFCANAQTIKKVSKITQNIGFFSNNHPFFSIIPKRFPKIDSVSGTVTMAALNFAIKMGFENINIIGADFGYLNGKTYAKGTYFDSIYNIKTLKTNTNETIFDKLLFRTNLIQEKTKKTTILLKNYEKSLEYYLNEKHLSYKFENFCYIINNNLQKTITFESFFTDFKYEELKNTIMQLKQEELSIILLPYIAYLRKNSKDLKWEEYLNKAHSDLLRLL